MQDRDPVVSADWLLEHIEAPDLRVVDATWFPDWVASAGSAEKGYDEAHIPGAVFIDIDQLKDPESSLPHMMPSAVMFSSRMRRLGIGDGNRVVVYDRNGFFASARVWWMLRVMGHDDVMVLNGGLDAWVAAGGATEDVPPAPAERHFTARVRSDLIKNIQQVAAASTATTSRIIDARPKGRFTGESDEPRPDLPSGHIPGSESLPHSAVLDDFGRMLERDALAPILGDTGTPIICTCGSGVSAAVLALAFARVGSFDAAVYDGSWSEWASDSARPVEKGAA